MKKTLLVLAVLVSIGTAQSAFACSPAPSWPPTAAENLSLKDVGFIGTVQSISQDKSVNGEYRITFSVDTVYKGAIEKTLIVRTRSSSAACGYDDGYKSFEVGSVWSVFANGTATDGYSTDSLSLNTRYESAAAARAALSKLGLAPMTDDDEPTMCTMIYAPVCGKTADGTIKTFGNSCTMGAEKGTLLYEGECTVTVSPAPTKDLWIGMHDADVTWLQEFLISKVSGAAASALKAVGATGYFGTLTKAALREYQNAYGITPASGYFGAKTRAQIGTPATPAPTAVFKGKIRAVDTACFADGICSVTVDGKKVILTSGLRMMPLPPLGSLTGVDSIGDLEKKIGSEAEVYAATTEEGGANYTLYGSTTYYVKVLK